MYKELKDHIKKLEAFRPSSEREVVLKSIIDFIQDKKEKGKHINLNFICTHNSRRSHLAQIWAQVLAHYFSVPHVYCFSGGTEATALYPKVVETLQHSGLQIAEIARMQNPVYAIKYDVNILPIIAFSKKYDHFVNPESNFAAIMTCDHADENCPFIVGAEKRIPLTFEDPKKFDGTQLQTKMYAERSLEIASQLYHVFSKVQL